MLSGSSLRALCQRKLPVYAQHARPGRQEITPVPVRAEGEDDDWNVVVAAVYDRR